MDDSIKISKESETRHNMISADGTVKYDFMMSLQNIAIVKIVTTLWMNLETQNEIVCVFRSNRYFIEEIEWKHIENSILQKTSNLLLPYNIFQSMKDVVKYLGKSIFRWFMYHNMYIFSRDCSAADFINNIIWTARGTIDYERTAKSILLHWSIFLDDKTKCKLACNYCFEDEIQVLTPKVKTMFRYENCDSEPMVYFWREQIAGDSICRNNNASLNERVIQCLINCIDGIVLRTWNDVPIRFVWNKLGEEEKSRNITSLIKKINNEDCLLSLVSSVCYDLQQKIFKKCHAHLLKSILNNWLWGEYFIPTIFIVMKSLESSEPLNYWVALFKNIYAFCIKSGCVNKYMHDNYKSVFKRLWCESSIQLKDFIIKYDKIFSLEWFVATELSWERDGDIAELIFNDLNAQQKKSIAFGKYGVQRCIDFILEDRWDLLELFLKYTLSTGNDVRHLKTRLMMVGHRKFITHLLNRGSVDMVEYFAKWAYKSEEERKKFRQMIKTSEFWHPDI